MNNDYFWTDELVKEFVIIYNKVDKLITGVDPIGQTIKEWKQSKEETVKPLQEHDFIWTEELAINFAIELRNDKEINQKEHKSWRDSLREFKERILAEFPETQKHDTVVDDKWNEFHPIDLKTYTQQEVDTIREEAFEAGRENMAGLKCTCYKPMYATLQDYLNSLQPTPTHSTTTGKEQEWEIVAYKIPGNAHWEAVKEPNGMWNGWSELYKDTEVAKGNWTIKRVKRKSDGIVFTVQQQTPTGIIKSFEINGDKLTVNFENGVYCSIASLFRLTPPTDKPVTDNTDVACLSLNDVKDLLRQVCGGTFSNDISRWNFILNKDNSPETLYQQALQLSTQKLKQQ